jgi:hypothetical protein
MGCRFQLVARVGCLSAARNGVVREEWSPIPFGGWTEPGLQTLWRFRVGDWRELIACASTRKNGRRRKLLPRSRRWAVGPARASSTVVACATLSSYANRLTRPCSGSSSHPPSCSNFSGLGMLHVRQVGSPVDLHQRFDAIRRGCRRPSRGASRIFCPRANAFWTVSVRASFSNWSRTLTSTRRLTFSSSVGCASISSR